MSSVGSMIEPLQGGFWGLVVGYWRRLLEEVLAISDFKGWVDLGDLRGFH